MSVDRRISYFLSERSFDNVKSFMQHPSIIGSLSPLSKTGSIARPDAGTVGCN